MSKTYVTYWNDYLDEDKQRIPGLIRIYTRESELDFESTVERIAQAATDPKCKPPCCDEVEIENGFKHTSFLFTKCGSNVVTREETKKDETYCCDADAYLRVKKGKVTRYLPIFENTERCQTYVVDRKTGCQYFPKLG